MSLFMMVAGLMTVMMWILIGESVASRIAATIKVIYGPDTEIKHVKNMIYHLFFWPIKFFSPNSNTNGWMWEYLPFFIKGEVPEPLDTMTVWRMDREGNFTQIPNKA